MLKIGTLPTDVAQWLNDNNVPVPSESVGNAHTRRYNEVKRKWNRTTVVRIAKDRTYLGNVINGKSKKVSYKSKRIIQISTEEQKEVIYQNHGDIIFFDWESDGTSEHQ